MAFNNRQLWFALKRLSLGIFLIILLSGILLVSDWNQRKPSAGHILSVAILQHASQAIMDEGVQGMLDGLAESGFVEGKSILYKRYNAEGDMATANTIAKEITGGQFDLILTASTLSLQTVANANKDSKTLHTFALVSDPFGAGVGINRNDPLNHPRHLVGIGTMQPVAEAFRLARTLFPDLKTVGVVWNPTEANSEANTRIARNICLELDVKLIETYVDKSSDVFEAANSLVARGAQALWVGGDVTVLVAIDSVLSAAKNGRIPVFTNIPSNAQRGALFDLGANYHEVGRLAGVLAGNILHGTDPATIPIKNVVPEKLVVNKQTLRGLKDSWQLPEDVLHRADEVIGQTDINKKETVTASRPSEAVLSKLASYILHPK